MRVYVPFTADRLASVLEESAVGPAPFAAAAVTAGRRAEQPGVDDEQLEHDAMTEAARRSLELLAQDPASAYRRLVVAADAEDRHVRPHERSGWVTVTDPVPLRRVAAFMVDGADTVADVSTAALTRAYDALDDVPLLWFAVGELSALVDEVGS